MNYFKDKMIIITKLKKFLEEYGFKEVYTPVLRGEGGDIISRIHLENDIGYLRDSHELQLRWLLTKYDAIYEVGACFRNESVEKNNISRNEFLLMELFTSKMELFQIKEMIKKFILLEKPQIIFEEISIAEKIKSDLGIDLFKNGEQERFFCRLKEKYSNVKFVHDYEYVLHYIENEVEPLSRGKVVFFTDYPECTCSYAKIKQGDVISRFELFANGLEIANGFDDECNPNLFVERNQKCPIFQNEEKEIVSSLLSGELPSSSGVGIGIERLCMFLFETVMIEDVLFPSKSF